jgi:guanylate kinase
MSRRGRLFVLSGPSGAGKDTIIDKVVALRPSLVRSVSATTRPPRAAERDGIDYHFLPEEDFLAMRERDELLEWAVVHGHLYGTPRGPIERALSEGHDVLLKPDVQGARNIKRLLPEAVLVFVEPPSFQDLVGRLERRGTEASDEIARRIQDAHEQLAAKGHFDHVIVNENADDAARALIRILEEQK